MEDLTGVILSAGKGTRIDPFSARHPKPLLPIGNRPIMEHHIELFRGFGIRKVVIVVGHLMDQIIGHFGRGEDHGVEIRYVEQEEILGIAHAAGRVEPYVDGPFLLCLGDIFYLGRHMKRILERWSEGDVQAILAVKRETDPAVVRRNFTVEENADGYVTRVVEKPRSPRSLLKGCGVYLFGPEIFDAIRRTPRTALRDEYEITNSIQILVDEGHKVRAEPVIDWDLNVTFPGDLLDGNLVYLDHIGADNLVHETARLAPETRLEHCVVGPGVSIEGPRTLEHCVVLENTRVGAGERLERCLLAGDIVIRC